MQALREFLLVNKTGYCEQFASGMALWPYRRHPSRVGIGFSPGQSGKDGEYTVRMHDMHAWPELYFQGIGWVRFEPTPAARVASTPNWTVAPTQDRPDDGAEHRADQSGGHRGPGDREAEGDRNLPDASGVAVIDSGNWFTNGGGRAIAIGAGVILLLSIPWLIRLTRRRRFAKPPGYFGAEGLCAEIRTCPATWDWTGPTSPRHARPATACHQTARRRPSTGPVAGSRHRGTAVRR